MPDPALKTCAKCGEAKPLTEFTRLKRSPDGFATQCKPCTQAQARAYRARRREQFREYDRKRAGSPRRRRTVDKARDRYFQANPEKRAAHRKVTAALKKGVLIRRPCERCGSEERIEAHHEDYSKPLDVNWLCKDCHEQRHIELREQERAHD